MLFQKVKNLSPKNLVLINCFSILFTISINIYFQIFCIPSTWAIIFLIICLSHTVLFPMFEHTKYSAFFGFMNGFSFFIFLYSTIFLDYHLKFLFILVFSGIGLVCLIPHLFILQILWKNLYKPIQKNTRIYFLFSSFLCICVLFLINLQYKKALIAIERFQKSNETTLEKSYFTEKILGMHLIYHTKICLYDGWRPPIHEPMLVLSLWMNKNIDPLPVSLKQRHFLYKKFFPENAIKQKCSCAFSYREVYFSDPLFD